MKRAVMILAEGFEEIEAIAPIDILTRSGVSVTVLSLIDGAVRAAYGSVVMPSGVLPDRLEPVDALIFPGGRANARALAADIRVIQTIKAHVESEKIVAAICAAPSHVLGEGAGVLRGIRATGDPTFNDRLAAAGAIVTNQQVTRDGQFITARGPGAAMLFGLELAEALAGQDIADGFAVKWGIDRTAVR